MKNIGILPWLNENALTPYPLSSSFGYNGFLVDANFTQFDNFTPVLSEIAIDDTQVVITLIIDSGKLQTSVNISDLATQGYTVKLYDNTRYVGCLVFGIKAYPLATQDMANQTFKNLNIKFLSHVVKSISSDSGVYSIQGKFGAVALTNTDGVVSYEQTGQNLTINAIAYPAVKDPHILKSINSVTPQNNNLYMLDNQVIKYKSSGSSELEILLVGGANGEVIVTNG